MSVLTFKEISNGRGGGEQLSGSRSIRRDTRMFHATTDSNYDDAFTVLAHTACPRIGQIHPNDDGVWCRGVRPEQEHGKRVWKITALYSNATRDLNEDPALDGLVNVVSITWGTERHTEAADQDVNGKSILNSAKRMFDPLPERDASERVAVVTGNYSLIPVPILDFIDVVNDDDFILDGVPVGKGTAKVNGLSVGKVEQRNEFFYRTVTLTFNIRKEKGVAINVSPASSDARGGKGQMWWKHILDAGFEELVDSEYRPILVTDELVPPTQPWPLSEGLKIDEPTVDNVVYIHRQVYPQSDFGGVLPGCLIP